MGALQSFDRMTFVYKYIADEGTLEVHVKGGEVVNWSRDTHKVKTTDAVPWAIEQWNKARAAYLEEAQEQELADRIARSRNED